MPKVRVIRRYNDLTLKKIKEKGEEFEVSEQRAQHLVKQKMVEIVEPVKSKKIEETK